MSVEVVAALLLIGLSAGLLAGLLGVGGGIVLVPAMVLVLAFDQHVAQGTSLLVVIPAAVAGSWTNHRHGRFQLRDAALLAAGGVIGAWIGSAVAVSVDGLVLRRLFGLLLLALGAQMLLPSIGRNPVRRRNGA